MTDIKQEVPVLGLSEAGVGWHDQLSIVKDMKELRSELKLLANEYREVRPRLKDIDKKYLALSYQVLQLAEKIASNDKVQFYPKASSH